MRSRSDTPGLHTPAALMTHSAAGELHRLGFFFSFGIREWCNKRGLIFGGFKAPALLQTGQIALTTAAERVKSTSMTVDQKNLHFDEYIDYYKCLKLSQETLTLQINCVSGSVSSGRIKKGAPRSFPVNKQSCCLHSDLLTRTRSVCIWALTKMSLTRFLLIRRSQSCFWGAF